VKKKKKTSVSRNSVRKKWPGHVITGRETSQFARKVTIQMTIGGNKKKGAKTSGRDEGC